MYLWADDMPGILLDILLEFLCNLDRINTNRLECANNEKLIFSLKSHFENHLKYIEKSIIF